MAKNKYKELSKNSGWTFLGNVGGKAIALLMLPFYTSILSVADYGILDMMTGYSATMCEVITLCIAQAIFVFPKDANENDKKKYFTSGLFYAFIFALTLGAVFKAIVSFCLSPRNVFNIQFDYIYLMAITSFLQNYLQNFIRSIGKMNVYGFIGIIYASFTAVFSVLFMPRWGLPGYIIAIVLANVIAAVYTFVAAKLYRYVGISNINWGKCKVLLFYSAPLVVNVLINFMTQFLNRPFMEYYQSLENVGLYSVASKFPTIISIMVPIFCMALQISVMEEFGKESYKRFYNNIFRLTTVILMSGCILFIPLGKYIVRLFAAPEYSAAWIYMPMLLLASVFNYWGYFSGTNFTAIKNSKYFLYSGIITVIVSIVSNFVFVSHYGLWGTCLASLSTSMTFFLSRLLFSWRYVKICRIQNYVYQIIMFTLVTFVCVNFDIDVVSIATGIGAALLLIYMNRDLLPLFLSQIKK